MTLKVLSFTPKKFHSNGLGNACNHNVLGALASRLCASREGHHTLSPSTVDGNTALEWSTLLALEPDTAPLYATEPPREQPSEHLQFPRFTVIRCCPKPPTQVETLSLPHSLPDQKCGSQPLLPFPMASGSLRNAIVCSVFLPNLFLPLHPYFS